MTTEPLTRQVDNEALMAAGVPPRYHVASWDEVTSAILTQLHEYCLEIDAHIRDGYGMTFLGPYGTGKSFASVLVLDAALGADGRVDFYAGDGDNKRPIYEPYRCYFCLASEMSVVLHRPSADGHMALIRDWTEADLLVIDDWHKMYLGADWDRSQLEALMDARHAHLRSTILTVNDLEVFKKLPGVRDRLRESGELVIVGDEVPSRRGR